MEKWIIVNKLMIIIYVVLEYINANKENRAIMILWILLYCSINICIYIIKKETLKKLFMMAAIIFIIGGYGYITPLFIMFLPINIYEFTDNYIEKRLLVSILALIPITFLEQDLVNNYLIILGFSYVIFTMTMKYTTRLHNLELQTDNMRKDMHRLTKDFNENKEYLRQSEYTFRLEERNRLSQEIHDKIGHSMTGALIQMEAAKSLMERDSEKAKELLTNSINISKEGIEDIRKTLKNLKPPKEQIGINRLKLIIDEFIEKSGIKTVLIYKGDIDIISYVQWKIIIENVSEALTNSMKYSNGANIWINIEVLNKFIKCEVRDNGEGNRLIKKGLGIIGMEERTAAIEGKIIVDGSSGFSVTTLLPIK